MREWLKARMGFGSPSRDVMASGAAKGFAEGLDPPPSTVPIERAEALHAAYALAERLKKIERWPIR